MPKGKARAGIWALLPFSMALLIAACIFITQPRRLHTWEMVIQSAPPPLPYIPGVFFYPYLTRGRHLAEQVELLGSAEVVEGAMGDPEWLAAKADSPRDRRRFRSRIGVIADPSEPPRLAVRFSDEESEVARIGLAALERSYLSLARSRFIAQDAHTVSFVRGAIDRLWAEQEATDDPERRRDCRREIEALERTVSGRHFDECVRVLSRRPVTDSGR